MPNYQVRTDVFPATVTLTPADSDAEPITYDKVRIVLTLDHVYIFRDGVPFETVFEDRLTTYTPPVRATRVRRAAELLTRYATFTTEEGYTAQFQQTGGCGCGSRLKTAKLDTLLPGSSVTQAASTNDSIAPSA